MMIVREIDPVVSKPKRSRGRPPGGEYAEKSAVINFRIRPDTKQLLQNAARTSGRTLSQEAEHQLRRALAEMGGTYAVLQTIGQAVNSLVNWKDPQAAWLHDPYLYRQARSAIIAALDLLQPEGAAPDQVTQQLDLGGMHQGQIAMTELLRKIQLVDPSIPLREQTPEQRQMIARKADLGALADRPRIHGRTAEQTRQAAALGREFAKLMRKAQQEPESMTDKDYEELWRLNELRTAANQPVKGGKQ